MATYSLWKRETLEQFAAELAQENRDLYRKQHAMQLHINHLLTVTRRQAIELARKQQAHEKPL